MPILMPCGGAAGSSPATPARFLNQVTTSHCKWTLTHSLSSVAKTAPSMGCTMFAAIVGLSCAPNRRGTRAGSSVPIINGPTASMAGSLPVAACRGIWISRSWVCTRRTRAKSKA